jgi:hypothetical protein
MLPGVNAAARWFLLAGLSTIGLGCGSAERDQAAETGGAAGSTSGASGQGGSGGDGAGSAGRNAQGGSGSAGTGGALAGGSGSGTGGRAGAAGSSAGEAGSSALSCKKNQAPPSGRCRTTTDCTLGALCSPTPFIGGCGASFVAMRLCETDTDCADGSVCLELATPPCTMGTPTQCSAACTATSCPADERCASSGHCEPAPCDDGFDCALGRVCDPGAPGVDFHGCRAADCTLAEISCPDDKTCHVEASNKDANGCAPKQCKAGAWTCADDQVCGDPTIQDAHGCRCASDATCGVDLICNTVGYCSARPCMADDDCECGVCVNAPAGQCVADFYYCALAPP